MTTEPKGMGGWLLFFVITLALRALLALLNALGLVMLMGQFPSARNALGALAALQGVMAVYTGWLAYVFSRSRPDAVKQLVPYFGFLLAFSLMVVLLRLWIHEPGLQNVADSLPRTAIAGVCYIAIWTTYFRKSRRVANTFGGPSVAPA